MHKNTNNIFLSDVKSERVIRRYIKSSIINEKNKAFNEPLTKDFNSLNANEKDNCHNNFFSIKNGANIISPYNNSQRRKYKSNIEEIVIKTNYLKKNLSFNNTTPLPIYKQKNKLSKVKLDIKKLLIKNNSSERLPLSNEYENNFKINMGNLKKKTFSKSFRGSSNYNINEDKSSFLSIENSRRNSYNKSKYIKKILHNSDIKAKSHIKIDLNNINNINNESRKKDKTIFIKKNINLIPINPKQTNNNMNNNTNNNINNNTNNNNNNIINTIFNNQMTNVTNVTFDTSVQNDFFNFTDANNQNNENESKTVNNDIENEIKTKIQGNNEIKADILLMIEEINKIKERQEQIINIENDNKIKNNEKNIKISNIIKKTYNFLNDFNKVINEQNQQLYQEILYNLNIFFNN